MLLIDMLASAFAAALAGLGVGSGGLLVIYLTLIAGVDQQMAQGINLLFFLFSGGAALAVHATRQKLYPGLILLMTLCGIGGSFLGTALSALLPPTLLRRLFGGLLVLSGAITLLRTRKKEKSARNPPHFPFR